MTYDMLAGEAPFKGRTTSHTIVQILENEPASLRQVARFNIPDDLDRIVGKALVKNVDERYQTAKDMLIDLRKLRKVLDVESEMRRSVGPALRQSRSEQTNAIAAASTTEVNTSRPVGIAVKLGILFGVIALLVGSLWAFNSWRLNQSSASNPTSATVPERVLTYSITVQKYRDNKPFEPPFQLSKEMLFERDYQIRLNVSSPQSGFLHLE